MKWVCVHGFKSFIILGKWVVDSVSGTTSHKVPRFYGMKENTCVGQKKGQNAYLVAVGHDHRW